MYWTLDTRPPTLDEVIAWHEKVTRERIEKVISKYQEPQSRMYKEWRLEKYGPPTARERCRREREQREAQEVAEIFSESRRLLGRRPSATQLAGLNGDIEYLAWRANVQNMGMQGALHSRAQAEVQIRLRQEAFQRQMEVADSATQMRMAQQQRATLNQFYR